MLDDFKENLINFKDDTKDKFVLLYGKTKKKRKLKKVIKKHSKRLTRDILKIAL